MSHAEFDANFLTWASAGNAVFPEALKQQIVDASSCAVGSQTASPDDIKQERNAETGDTVMDGGIAVVVATGLSEADRPAPSGGDMSRISATYFSMIWAVVMSRAKPSQVADIIATQPPPSHPAHQPVLCTAFVDSLWLAGVQIESGFGLPASAVAVPVADDTPAGGSSVAAAQASSTAYLTMPEWSRLCTLVKETLARRM